MTAVNVATSSEDIPNEEVEVDETKEVERWQPKKWKPLYDQIIILHIGGYNNVKIGEALGLSKMQVGNVVNCDMGQALANAYRAKVIEDTQDKIQPMLRAMAIEGTRRMKEALASDKVWEEHPLGAIDRTLKVLSAVGEIESEKATPGVVNNTTNNTNTINLFPKEIGDRIAETLEMLKSPTPKMMGNHEGKNTLLDEHKVRELPMEKLDRLEGKR